MSDTLLDWLNKEVKLSEPITDISKQFANGYLFGELLSKYKQLPTFFEFKNTNNTLDITRNYSSLQKTCADLGIRLTGEDKQELLQHKKYKAEMLLLKIKQKMSQKLINFNSILEKTSLNQLHSLYKEMQFGAGYQTSSNFKPRSNLKPPTAQRRIQSAGFVHGKFNNTFNPDLPFNKINKFKPTQTEQKIIKDVISEEENQHQQEMLEKMKIFTLENTRHKEVTERDQQGYKNWAVQMEKKKKYDKEMYNNSLKEAIYLKGATKQSFVDSSESNVLEVKAFDENLSKLGLDLKVIDPKAGRGNKKTINTEIFLQHVREQLSEKEKSRKDKEKRQRKIASANNAMKSLMQKTGSSFRPGTTATNKFMKTTTTAFHKVSTRATTARPFAPKQLPPIIKTETNWDDYVSVDVFDEKRFFGALDKISYRYQKESSTWRLDRKKKDSEIVRPVVYQLIELCEECFNYQQVNNKELVDIKEWKILMEKFIRNEELYIYERKKVEKDEDKKVEDNHNYSSKSEIKKEDMEKITKFERDELFNYINYLGAFDYEVLGKTPTIKLDLMDVMGADISILENEADNQTQEEDSFYADSHHIKTKPTFGMINEAKEIYEPRTEDLEMLKPPQENEIDLFFGEVITNVITNKFSEESKHNIDAANVENFVVVPEEEVVKTEEGREGKEGREEKDEGREEKSSQHQTIDQHQPHESTIEVPPEHSLKEIFESFPIKVSFIGTKYAGKGTQANLVKSEYDKIRVYSVSDIIKELLEMQTKFNTPIEAHPKFKSLKKAQLEQMKNEKVQLEQKLRPFKKLLEEYDKEEDKENLPDEMQVDFLITKMQNDLEYIPIDKVKETITAKRARIEKINEELDKIKEEQVKKPKAKVKEQQALNAELRKLNAEGFYGFVILNFPKNAEQARLFEYKVNGYKQMIEEDKSPIDISKDKLLLLCDREIKQNKSSTQPCVLNRLFLFEVTEEEMINRSNNRKLDPNTGIIYHATYNPHNDHDKKLRERLVDLPGMTEDQVHEDMVNYVKNYDEIMEFYLNFIFTREEINTMEPKEESYNKIKMTLDSLVEKFETILVPIPPKPTTEVVENEGAQGVSHGPGHELVITVDDDNKSTTNIERVKTSKSRRSGLQTPKRKGMLTFGSSTSVRKPFDFSSFKVSTEVVLKIYEEWDTFSTLYVNNCYQFFYILHHIDENVISQLTEYQKDFIKFLSTKSNKTKVMNKFKQKYKAFVDKYNILKFNNLVREEFHKDLNEVTEQIWGIIESRKNEAIKELESITTNGFLEKELAKIFLIIERMFILESEKLIRTVFVVIDYYYSNEKVSFSFNYDIATELLNNTDELKFIEPSGKRYTYPKLYRLFKNCYVLLFKLSVALKSLDRHASLSKTQSELIVHKKKRAGGVPSARQGNTSASNDTDFEFKQCIQTEIKKYKFRINVLSNYSMKKLLGVHSLCKEAFEKMDNWIIEDVKLQNDAMNEIITAMRDIVENGKVHELTKTVEFDNFSSTYEISDFKPKVEEEEEETSTVSFSVNFLVNALQNLKDFEIQHNVITKTNLVEVLIKKELCNHANKKFLSKKFNSLNFHNYSNFLEYFVFKSSDVCIEKKDEGEPQELILNHVIMTVILLSNYCEVCHEEQAKEMKESVKDKIYRNCLMKKEDFINITFWFEKTKVFQDEIENLFEDEKNLPKYNKLRKFKEALFFFNKMNEEEINVDLFFDVVTLKTITKAKEKKSTENIKNYFDLFLI